MTTGGFAGFQTQLSTTSNKRRSADAPLLEAFLDENGRLAYRFIDKDGNIVAQPKVTTPGFVQPGLGGSSTLPPASGTPSSITPQASGVLTGGVREGFVDRSADFDPNLGAGTSDLSFLEGIKAFGPNVLNMLNPLSAINFIGGAMLDPKNTAPSLVKSLKNALTSPPAGSTELAIGDDPSDFGATGTGSTATTSTGLISPTMTSLGGSAGDFEGVTFGDTSESISALDTMTSLGGSAGDFEGVTFDREDGSSRDSGGDLGRGESPTGDDVAGTPF